MPLLFWNCSKTPDAKTSIRRILFSAGQNPVIDSRNPPTVNS